MTLDGREYLRSGAESRETVLLGSRYLLKSVVRLKSPKREDDGGGVGADLLLVDPLLPLLLVVLLLPLLC